MNEDFATRAWAERHGQLSSGIDTAVRTIMDSLKVLNRQQYDAPWQHPAPRGNCAEC